MTADDSIHVVICLIGTMRIDGGRTCLKTDARTARSVGYRAADDARRVQPSPEGRDTVRSGVPAIAVSACKVDDDVCAVNLTSPIAKRRCIPGNRAPRALLWMPTQHNNFMAVIREGPCEDGSDLARAA